MPRLTPEERLATEVAKLAFGLEPTSFINHYRCTECGHGWNDKWSCMTDDECAACGTIMSPYDSDALYPDEEYDNG